MIYRMNPPDDEWLLDGVRSRRVFAFFIDILLIGLLFVALCLVLFVLGLVTLGFGMPLLGVLPFVPFGYHFLSVCGPSSATPGQQAFDLIVRRNSDLGRPTPLQAFIYVLLFDLTLMTTGLLLLVALFTDHKRTLHDIGSGLVVVRTQALTRGFGSWNMQGGSPYA